MVLAGVPAVVSPVSTPVARSWCWTRDWTEIDHPDSMPVEWVDINVRTALTAAWTADAFASSAKLKREYPGAPVKPCQTAVTVETVAMQSESHRNSHI